MVFEIRDKAGKLVGEGDGHESFKRSRAKGFEAMTAEEARALPRELSTDRYKAQWEEVLTLKIILIDFPELGFWEFRTKGKETSIPQIRDTFDLILNSHGRVALLPFSLEMAKVKSSRAEANRQYPVAQLTCNLSVSNLEALANSNVSGLVTAEKLELDKALPPAIVQSAPTEEK